jgi:hypothetical protein
MSCQEPQNAIWRWIQLQHSYIWKLLRKGQPTMQRNSRSVSNEIGKGVIHEVLNDILWALLSLRLAYERQFKGNGKVVPVLNYFSTKPWRHKREWRYSYTILDLVTRWRWVVSFTPRYSLDRRLGGPQSRSGRCGEVKNLALPGTELKPSSP